MDGHSRADTRGAAQANGLERLADGYLPELRRRAWSQSRSLGLACDLSKLPPPRPARIPVLMEPVASERFHGFDDEVLGEGTDRWTAAKGRAVWCRNGIRTLYVTFDEARAPVYAQWLISPDDQKAVDRLDDGFARLQPDESMVEGAYAFHAFRRAGAMSEGMHQLLCIARDAGARRVLTLVAESNVAALRGCANVGFGLDSLRIQRKRFNVMHNAWYAPDEAARTAWETATAPQRRPAIQRD
jgi:hypothetical protein